jgi:paraquat-inducible protein B
VVLGTAAPLARRRLRLPPPVVTAAAAAAPLGLSIAARRSRLRDVAICCLQMNAYVATYEMPHDDPERLRSRYRDPSRQPMADLPPKERIARFVERGLRAQLASANLLTGQKMVTLEFFPKAPKVKMDPKQSPPEIPTMSSGQLAELQESIQNIVSKLEKVPFEQIAADLRKTLQQAEATLRKAESMLGEVEGEIAPELKATLQQARKTLGNADKALGSVDKALSSDSPLQGDLRETLLEVTKTMESLRALTDYLERHPEAILRGKARTGDLR